MGPVHHTFYKRYEDLGGAFDREDFVKDPLVKDQNSRGSRRDYLGYEKYVHLTILESGYYDCLPSRPDETLNRFLSTVYVPVQGKGPPRLLFIVKSLRCISGSG